MKYNTNRTIWCIAAIFSASFIMSFTTTGGTKHTISAPAAVTAGMQRATEPSQGPQTELSAVSLIYPTPLHSGRTCAWGGGAPETENNNIARSAKVSMVKMNTL